MKRIQNMKGLLPLFVLLTLAACQKETTNIGVDLLPGKGLYSGTLIELDNIRTRSVSEVEIRTDALSTAVLGSMNDPLFGNMRASVATRPRLPVLDYNMEDLQYDSVAVIIKFDLTQLVKDKEVALLYGDLDDEITIDVFRLNEDLNPDSAYFHNHEFEMGSTPLGTFTGKLPFYDSVEVKTEKDTFLTGPELRIRLDDAFGQELIGQPASVYGDQELFLEYIKGLVFVPRMDMGVGQGVFAGIDLSSSESVLRVYHDSSKTKDFVFKGSLRVALYDVVDQGVQISQQHAGSGHFPEVYAQSLAGSKVRIELPQLDSIIRMDEDVVINEAVLRIKIKEGSFDDKHKPPVRMLLLIPNDNGGNEGIVDFTDDIAPPPGWSGNTNYGGYLSADEDGYEFHFNRYLQQLIREYKETGENNFEAFHLVVPSDFAILPSRVTFDTDPSGIEVYVTYTKLN